MALNTSGTLKLGRTADGNVGNSIAGYYRANVGGSFSTSGQFSQLSYYRGKTAYKSTGAFAIATTNLKISDFYGSSPLDEWNCNCNCTGCG